MSDEGPKEPRVIQSLRTAIEAAPDDLPLRLLLAEQLLLAGSREEALSLVGGTLQLDPTSSTAQELMGRLLATAPGAVTSPAAASQPEPDESVSNGTFDWRAAESQLEGLVPAMFVERDSSDDVSGDAYDVEVPRVRLSDVGGMEAVKQRLEAALFAPIRNPELMKLYGKKLHGGLLLYGPPGCGKTFIARAVAGELSARFIAVTLADVLDMWLGQSERNLHEVFQTARRNAPCVLFLDEVDAIGQKRSQLRSSALRGSVNQLLLELDDIGAANESVFVLAATNHPWDVDAALRRPGRFDRTVLVLPPDESAREAILRLHLRDRPIAGIDVTSLARATEGYSGADLAHICEVAAERALLDSAATGNVRMIEQHDLTSALAEVRPSTGAWFEAVRNVVRFANQDGTYDELAQYLQSRRML
jgi:SpoVK/Ycf46/Vps4 family AAA+-type ATPase